MTTITSRRNIIKYKCISNHYIRQTENTTSVVGKRRERERETKKIRRLINNELFPQETDVK